MSLGSMIRLRHPRAQVRQKTAARLSGGFVVAGKSASHARCSILPQRRHRLPPGITGLQLVPVGDAVLAELPAEADLAALVFADEVDQALAVVLQLAADFGQLIDVILKVG